MHKDDREKEEYRAEPTRIAGGEAPIYPYNKMTRFDKDSKLKGLENHSPRNQPREDVKHYGKH